MSGHLPQEGLPQQAHPLQTAHPLPLLTPPGGAPVPLSGPALAQSLVSSGYLLCEELGRGGLGQVNAAMQRVFGRTVAIKQLVDGVTSDRAITKFVAEALIAALLEHPNIVPIHDLIIAADGRLQLVMKRVEGLSWGSLLSPETAYQRAYSQSMTLDDHLDILMKVCDAIAFAHGKGIVHLDLKPDNVMVGAFGEVLVMDWGCAMALVEGQHHPLIACVRRLTSPAGTPSYMAPELATAQADRIGTHSDVYELGAILYELLTGQQPNRVIEVDEVMRDAAFGTLVPPQEAAPSRDIPDELADICMQCLHKEVDTRIPTVGALSVRLTAYRRHAQAVSLAARSRTLIIQARAAGAIQDELLRQALSSAEQAYAIWPEWRNAGLCLVNAQLSHAQYHLDHGATTAAHSGGMRAAQLSATLGMPRLEAQARRLAEAASAAARAQEAHHRHFRAVRIALAAALGVLVVGLVISIVVVTRAEGRMGVALGAAEHARIEAEAAVTSLTTEQQRRSEDQKVFAPAVIAEARRQIEEKRFDRAAKALSTAILFDAHLLEARSLYANVLVAGGHYTAAQVAIADWLALAPGDAQAMRLRALCAQAHDGVEPDLELKNGLAAVFAAQGLSALAEGVTVALPDRLELYRKRLEAAWPGSGVGLAIRPDGLLTTTLERRVALAERRDIVDIAALAGMPFAVLNLSGTQVQDLTPLRGMPLEELNLEHTPVADLSPLAGLRLSALLLSGSRVSALDPVKGMPLKRLSCAETRVSSLVPLEGMSFTRLDISRSPVESLAPLAGPAQGEIIARQTKVHALSPLIGTLIASLDVTFCHLDDLAVLAQLHVRQFAGLSVRLPALPRLGMLTITGLDLGTCPELTDLGALRGMRLSSLIVSGSPVTDLSPLASMPLRSLTFRNSPVRSLAPLTNLRLEYLKVDHTQIDDCEPLRGMPLRVLFIDHTRVSDVSVLASLPLEEVHLGPLHDRALTGLDALRHLTSIRQLGTAADQVMPPGPFWAGVDAGTIP